LTIPSATPKLADVVAADWASHQICTGNVPGLGVERRCVLKEAAVIKITNTWREYL